MRIFEALQTPLWVCIERMIEMSRPQYNDDRVKDLREELKKFVAEKYPYISFLAACNWAFYPLNPKHNIGIDFWDIFKSDENMLLCFDLLVEDAVNKGTVGNPKGDARAYFKSITWLKELLDEKYDGVEGYLKKFD